MNERHQTGMTFIELIISMVIIGIAVSGVLSVMNLTTARSADPMIQHQAIAIAEAYLEEILTRRYDDPASECAAHGGDRSLFCVVDDYDGLSEAPTNQFGVAISGLGNYTVSVTVVDEALSGIASKRIDVAVSHPSGMGASLSGYRAGY